MSAIINEPKGRYDTAIALAVVALFAIFGFQFLTPGDDTSDELHPLDDDRTQRAGFLDARMGDADRSFEYDNRSEQVREAELEEAYQQGRAEAQAMYEYEIRQLDRQIQAYERAIYEWDERRVR